MSDTIHCIDKRSVNWIQKPSFFCVKIGQILFVSVENSSWSESESAWWYNYGTTTKVYSSIKIWHLSCNDWGKTSDSFKFPTKLMDCIISDIQVQFVSINEDSAQHSKTSYCILALLRNLHQGNHVICWQIACLKIWRWDKLSSHDPCIWLLPYQISYSPKIIII